jgi:Kelch motif/Galactose oxidase, central domain
MSLPLFSGFKQRSRAAVFIPTILFTAIMGAVSLMAPTARGGVSIQLQYTRNCTDNQPYYLLFPVLSADSNGVPTNTAYFVWSASSSSNNGAYGDLLPNGTNPYGGAYYADDFTALLADATNLWTLVVTNLTSTNLYQFRFSSFASNTMPLVSMVYPMDGATNVPTLPTFAWTALTNYESLYVQASQNGGNFYEDAFLDSTATNWPSPDALAYGDSYNFFPSYSHDASLQIVSTVPTNWLGQSFSGWSSTVSLNDFTSANFTVTNPFSGPLGLAFALNDTNLTWQTSGDSLWFAETNVTEDGQAAAQSGELQADQMSVLQTTVTGPGQLTFWWETAGIVQDDFDLEFSVDGNDTNDIYSQTPWQQQTYNLPAGTHTLEWTAYSDDDYDTNDFGYLDLVSYTQTVILPPPSPGQWTLTGTMSNTIYLQTSTLLPNGKVLVAGGSDNDNNPTALVQLYDPGSGKWTVTNSLPGARYGHTATLLTNGYVLVAGGVSDFSDAGLVTNVELYNPTNSTWIVTGGMNYPRYGHTATLLANGTVLVAGGMGSNGPNPNITNIYPSEIYNPNTGKWTVSGSLTVGRINHTATLLQSGKVLVTGGSVTNVILVTGECELYDPNTGNWSPTASMNDILAFHTATLLPNGQVLVAGGDTSVGTPGGFSYYPVSDAELYDPNSQMWANTGSLNHPRDNHTATLMPNGLVMVTGTSMVLFITNSTELYNPSNGMWYAAAQMNYPRIRHTATLLPNGTVLAAGGLVANAELYNSVAAPTIVISNLAVLAGGEFQFNWSDTPGSSNEVLFSTNPATPLSNWMVLGEGNEISSGYFQYSDSQATNKGARYYRVRTP